MSIATSPTHAEHETHDGHAEAHGPGKAGLLALTVGSVGVVYGDIGTSPLYAFREALHAAGHADTAFVPRETVLGVLSLIFWALILVVTIKYVLILLRADNNGEGGTLSLMALAQRAIGRRSRYVFTLGVMGAALFYGDSVLTPAISVLSAVEGVKLLTPALDPYVLPITVVILLGLFAAQSRGTGKVAAFFGPVMLVWFAAIGVMGASHIADDPGVFAAFNPVHGLEFLGEHGMIGLFTLGSVFLAVTGGEALYADLGHFGRRPIQWAWFIVVLPALMLNYLGQGALVLSNPAAAKDPFFLMAPAWALAPLVVLATLATVIASQAVITGAFSLTRQAIQLGLLPRLEIRHTSASHSGQIYLPRINTMLLIGVLFLVVTFRSSTSLASAYGISVTGAMVIDALLCGVVIWRMWGWPLWGAVALMLPFLVIDLGFFGANLFKFLDGGYIPLALAAALITLMLTWVRGSAVLTAKTHKGQVPLADLLRSLERRPPHVVKGTAIFLTGDPGAAPTALLHNLKHNRVLHERNIVLTIRTANTPRVPDSERVAIQPVSERFTTVNLTFGYMETPSVPKGLALCRKRGLAFDIMSTSFFLSRRAIRADPKTGMPLWQDKLFIAAAHSAADATAFFQVPSDRVVEIGTRVTV